MKRGIRAFLCTLLAASLAACGAAPAGTAQSGTAGEPAGQETMGRWVESTVDLGGREVVGGPMLRADGTLVLYTGENDLDAMTTGSLMRLTSADNGETWTEEDTGWGELVGGPVLQVLEAADGTACLTCVTQRLDDRGQNEYCTYLVQPGGQPEPLQFDGIENGELSATAAAFCGDALVFVVSNYPAQDITCELVRYDLTDKTTTVLPLDLDTSYGVMVQPAAAGDKLLFTAYGDNGIKLVSLDPQTGAVADVLDPLSAAISSALTADESGAVYYPSNQGIYRLAAGGTLPEQIVPADATNLSVESNYPHSICRAANGDFLVSQLNMGDETQTVYRYHYDESLPTHAATTLNVWALEDSATARAAVTVYKQQHPEVDVNFTVALQADAADPAAARNDALTQLNTQLLAGEGPDVLLLDGVDYETYVQKGILADLSGAAPLDELQQNLVAAFVQDGKAFVLPARFSVPVLVGDDGTLDGLDSLAALQQAVLDAAPRADFGDESPDYYDGLPDGEKYALGLTDAEDMADFLLPVCAGSILQDGALDADALRETLTFVQTVADYYGMGAYTLENNVASTQSWSGADPVTVDAPMGEYTYCNRALYGWAQLDTPYAALMVARNGDPMSAEAQDIPFSIIRRPGLTDGAYTPKVLVGVNAASQNLEQAQALAATFFGRDVQENYYNDGMAVRADCLAEKLGAVLQNESYDPAVFTGDLKALLDGCTTPVAVPAVLRDSFVQHANALIVGEESVDEAAAGMERELSLYLAEQQ